MKTPQLRKWLMPPRWVQEVGSAREMRLTVFGCTLDNGADGHVWYLALIEGGKHVIEYEAYSYSDVHREAEAWCERANAKPATQEQP